MRATTLGEDFLCELRGAREVGTQIVKGRCLSAFSFSRYGRAVSALPEARSVPSSAGPTALRMPATGGAPSAERVTGCLPV
jgi:hypothetical protein